MSIRRLAPLAVLAAIVAAVTCGGQVLADSMSAATPEHVSEALAALQHNKTSTAKKDLNMAIGEKLEPKDARMHAQEALSALKKGDKATAKMHATNGAGVEHFTYALRALNAGKLTGTGGAEDHLGEASKLSKFHKQAAAAIKAIKKKNVKSARKHIKAGLALTNKE